MPQEAKKQRRDALANRDTILAVAREEFAANGLNVSMDRVAKNAGLGAGTLYRHFPNREALLGAVLEEDAPDVATERRTLEETENAADAVDRWLEVITQWSGSFDGAATPMRNAIHSETGPLTAKCTDMIAILDRLLEKARATGAARSDVNANELFLAALGMTWAAEHTGNTDSLLHLLRSGWAA